MRSLHPRLCREGCEGAGAEGDVPRSGSEPRAEEGRRSTRARGAIPSDPRRLTQTLALKPLKLSAKSALRIAGTTPAMTRK